MNLHWQSLQYGNPRQRVAYQTLYNLRIMEILDEYSPILVGTIPIEIDVENSDLDIICTAQDLQVFEAVVQKQFGNQPDFQLKYKIIREEPTFIANFNHNNFEIELFAQNVPTIQQNAYIHMIIEHRLLKLGGEALRKTIRQLKQDGIKTEPAFTQFLGLEGDPYLALLDIVSWDNDALQNLLLQVKK